MRNKGSCSALLLAFSMLCHTAGADVGATSIMQVRAPLLLHADGTGLNLTREERFSTIWINGSPTTPWGPTTRAAICDGHDCARQPLGFLPGATLPQGVDLRAAEVERRHLTGLADPDAYEFLRSDVHVDDDIRSVQRTYARSRYSFSFSVDTSESLTLSLDALRYTHAFMEAGVPDGSFVETRSRLAFELYDLTTSATVMLFEPEEFNTTSRLDEADGAVLHQDTGWLHLSAVTGTLDPTHRYWFDFFHETYSSYVANLPTVPPPPVPEPSTLLMLVGGLACVVLARRRQVRPWLASCALVLSGTAWAGASSTVGIDLYQPRLLHSDGTRYGPSDFVDPVIGSHHGVFEVKANGKSAYSGGGGAVAWQQISDCTGTACGVSPFPAAVSGDTAHGTLEWWRMADFVTADSFQRIAASASAISRPSRVELDTITSSYVFEVEASAPMTFTFDARAYGEVSAVAGASAFAELGFRVSLKENWTGSTLTFAPDALNLRLDEGDAPYDTGLLTFSFDVPMLYTDRQYFLVLEQSLVTELLPAPVPEPAPAAMYAIGALGALGWAMRRRSRHISG